MQRFEVERIFEDKKAIFLKNAQVSDNPIAILLGGQPASGKTRLTLRANEEHVDTKFLVVNGDEFCFSSIG